jgi:hypothetical protein
MQTARRRGRASFLSQIPEVPPAVTQSDPLTDFFVAVQRTYERAQEAIDTAKTGFNLDVAKTTITGGGGAQEWNDKAFALLQQAKDQNLITAGDASELAQQVMMPLGQVISKALDLIQTNQSAINANLGIISDMIATVISNSTGWCTQKWHDLAKTYRLASDYMAQANVFLAGIQGAAQSMDAKNALDAYRVALGKVDAQKTYLETTITAAGIPLQALKDQAAKEDVSTLGAEPATGILATAIVGTITIGMVLKAIAAVLAIIGTGFLFEFYDVAFSLVGLSSVIDAARKKKMALELQTKKEFDQAQSDAAAADLQKKNDQTKAQINVTMKTMTGMAQVAGLQAKADELKQKLAAEQAKAGVETPVSQQDWFPWAVAIGGGVVLATVIYWYTHRKGA